MKKLLTTFGCAALLSAGISTHLSAQPSANLFLVHGAHFSANAWKAVENQLPSALNTISVDLPGRHDNFIAKRVNLELSAAALCSELAKTDGDKIVAAHSQAGAVINATLALCPDPSLKKIIYITAVSPLNGESPFDLLSKQDGDNYFSGIHYNEKSSVLEISDIEGFTESFAPNANESQKAWLKQHAVPEPSKLGGNKLILDESKFKSLQKYYIYATQDKVISLATQQKIAARMDLTNSYNLDSGHLPMLTHPEELAVILEKIVTQ